MANEVTLTAAMRSNLLLLQRTDQNIQDTQLKLATGNRINSALDGPTEFFAAKGLNQRAGDLSGLKDAMGQAISTIKAADTGITSIEKLIEQMRGLTTSALGSLGNDEASIATRKALSAQFDTLKTQIDKLAQDSGYQGKNLLVGDGLQIDSTSTSRSQVNTINGISNARATNVISADTYSLRVTGDGAIDGNASDITAAEFDRGLVSLNVSGTLSTSLGSFNDFTISTVGSVGRLRTFTVADGDESRVTRFFDNSQAAETNLTTAAASGVSQTSTVTIEGTIEEGDIFSIRVDGKTYEYKAGISADGSVAEGAETVASNLAALISGNNVQTYYRDSSGIAQLSTVATIGDIRNASNAFNSGLTGQTGSAQSVGQATFNTAGTDFISATGGVITISGDGSAPGSSNTTADAPEEFVISSTTTNSLEKRISESFASGAVVSFVIDRLAMEEAGNGTTTIEKNVNLQITATSLSGEEITRDGENRRGDMKLADGENSFAFDSGTVRLTVDERKVYGASSDIDAAGLAALGVTSVKSAANLITQQTADPNTQNDITVVFNERRTSNITVESQNVQTSGQGLRLDFAQNDWLDRADIEKAVDGLDYAKQQLRNASQSLSTNLNIITTRENYTKEFSNVLEEGANKLTLADQNEEGTKLLMLQTRQQLGTISLSIANQQQQAILQLF